MTRGVPTETVDSATSFNKVWGGLVLPPGFECDGGPGQLGVCDVALGDRFGEVGWWIECGTQRYSVPYSFMLSPAGVFGVVDQSWVPLFSSVNGWVEAVSLAHAATEAADFITRVSGVDVDALEVDTTRPVREVGGINVQWMHGDGRLVAIDRSYAVLFDDERHLRAKVFAGDGLATLLMQP